MEFRKKFCAVTEQHDFALTHAVGSCIITATAIAEKK